MSFFDDDENVEPTRHNSEEFDFEDFEEAPPRRGFDFRALRDRVTDYGFGVRRGRQSNDEYGDDEFIDDEYGIAVDPAVARRRQAVAALSVLAVLLLLAFAFNSCRKSGSKSQLKEYSNQVNSLLKDSLDNVGQKTFDALDSGNEPTEIESSLSGYAQTAKSQLEKAKALDYPKSDKGTVAQRNLELAMSLRATAVTTLASEIRNAQADSAAGESAQDTIAGQVQAMLASDVVLGQRTVPLINEAIKDASVDTPIVVAPKVVRDVGWAVPASVAERLGGGSSSSKTAACTANSTEKHGHQIVSVSMGGTTLKEGSAANSVSGNEITVSFQNGGDKDESNVKVKATLVADGATLSKTTKVASTKKGVNSQAEISFDKEPSTGVQGELTIEVEAVPCEKDTTNNKKTFTVSL